MLGLLKKAIPIHEYYSDIDSIPKSERDSIYSEMEEAISHEKTAVTDQTFNYISQRNDRILPLVLNIGALCLTAAIAFSLNSYFGHAEKQIITGSRTINLTENQIITALKEESDKKLSAKESEIAGIQSEMDALVQEQTNLQTASRIEIEALKARLREKMDGELNQQEQILINSGLSSAELERQLSDLRARMEADFQKEEALLIEQADQERLLREQELQDRISGYQSSLTEARQEKDALTAEFSDRVDKIRSGLIAENESIKAEYNRLVERNRNEQFVLNQINESYNALAGMISTGQNESSLLKIRQLEDFLKGDDISDYQGIIARRSADLELLSALRSLITDREQNRSSLILDEIRNLTARGDGLWDEGDTAGAEDYYSKALNLIPLLGTAYARLQELDSRDKEENIRQFSAYLKQAGIELAGGSAELSLALYRSALQTLAGGPEVEQIITNVQRIGRLQAEEVMESDRTLLWQTTESALNSLESSSAGSTGDSPDIIGLLGRKVLIKDILSSEGVRKTHPGAAGELDRYLEDYGRISEERGKSEAIGDITALLLALSEDRTPDPAGISSDKAYTQLIDALKELTKGIIYPE